MFEEPKINELEGFPCALCGQLFNGSSTIEGEEICQSCAAELAGNSDAVSVTPEISDSTSESEASVTPENTTMSSVSYLVQIKIGALNVRKGPGTNYEIAQTLMNDKSVYTIDEEADGPGAAKWGRLASGAGWLSLDYVAKV